MSDSGTRTWMSRQLSPRTPATSGLSRGLRYGDGVFATVGVRAGVLLDAELQMSRLNDAATAIGLAPPDGFEHPASAAESLAAIVRGLEPGVAGGVARLQWFAGAGPRGFGRPTMQAVALVDLSPEPETRTPSLVILADGRVPIPALPNHKTCSALANVLCAREAARLGADAALRVVSGVLLETDSSNVFWLREGTLFTPADTLPLYAGSVRERVLECAPSIGLGVEEGEFGTDALVGAETVFLTNAARGIEVVRSVDGDALGEAPEALGRLAAAVDARRIERGVRCAAGPLDAHA